MIFHAGAVQGYRAALAMLPDHDFGVALLWNSGSAVPADCCPPDRPRARIAGARLAATRSTDAASSGGANASPTPDGASP
ncbi:MAG: hypothetical protein IPG63_18350 [Xanthomonadales bacterium]|nr:hypothetical protein [Xanthomonadales bacterium]